VKSSIAWQIRNPKFDNLKEVGNATISVIVNHGFMAQPRAMEESSVLQSL